MAGVHLRRLEKLLEGDQPKVESCLELHFFGSSQRTAWGASRSVGKGSRRLSGLNVFSRYISGRWRDFLQGIDPKPEAVRSYSFSGHRSGPLREPHDRWEKAAGGCLAGTSFRGTFPKAGVAFRRGSPQSWRRPGLNVFSERNSEGWRYLLLSIDPKPKAVWSYTFSGHRRGSLGEPRGRCGKAAGSGRA